MPINVRNVQSLERLEQHLAARYDGVPDTERDALVERLNQETLESQLADALIGYRPDPEAAALPLDTVDARIRSFTKEPQGIHFSDVAMRGARGWVAQFSLTVDAVIDLTRLRPDPTTIDKPLQVVGRLEVDAQGSTVWLLVSSADALPMDRMRRRWELSDREIEELARVVAESVALPDLIEMYKKMQEENVKVVAETLAALPGVIETYKKMQEERTSVTKAATDLRKKAGEAPKTINVQD